MSSSLKPSTVAVIAVGTVVTGFIAYACYFDHRRRTDPEFRKALKRDSKRQARAAKEEAEAEGKKQKKAIREAVARANEEGFPKDSEEVEAYFMQEVAQGEGMCQQGTWRLVDGRDGRMLTACRRRLDRGRPLLLPRFEGLSKPQRAHQYIRQDRAQGKAAPGIA